MAERRHVTLVVFGILLLLACGLGFFLYSTPTFDNERSKVAERETVEEIEVNEIDLIAVVDDKAKLFICRAAIASMMGRDLVSVQGFLRADDIIETSYKRPSDNSIWKNRCYLDGPRVIWSTIEGSVAGRWRTAAKDELVTYDLTTDRLVINEDLGSGMVKSDTFERN